MGLSVGIRLATFCDDNSQQNMSPMSRLGQFRLLIGSMLLLFLSAAGCSRPTPGLPAENTTSTGQTPFEDSARGSGEDGAPTTAVLEKNIVGNLPFENRQVLPAGSLLTVRLKSPLTAENEGSKGTFAATVDEPVIAEGMTLIPEGAQVSGRIGQVRISNMRPDRGYVRLELESVSLDGFDLPVQTADLFARQISGDVRPGTIRLEKGRRLTFRLTEPFYPGAQHSSAVR